MPSWLLSSLCHPKMMQTFERTWCNDKISLCHPTSHCSHQCVNARRLPGAAGPEGHHAVSDPLSLKQLDDLQLPGWVTDQACVLHLRENRNLVQPGRSGFNSNKHRHHLPGPHDKLTQCSGHRKTPKVTDITKNPAFFHFSFISPFLSALFVVRNGLCVCQTITQSTNRSRKHQLRCILLQTCPLAILVDEENAEILEPFCLFVSFRWQGFPSRAAQPT